MQIPAGLLQFATKHAEAWADEENDEEGPSRLRPLLPSLSSLLPGRDDRNILGAQQLRQMAR